MPRLSLTGRHAREMTIVFVAQAGSALAAIAAVKLLTLFLTPADFGYTAVVTSYVVAITGMLVPPVSGTGMVDYHARVKEGRARELLGTLLVLTLLLLAVPAIGLLLHRPLDSLDRTRSVGGLIVWGFLFLAAELLKGPVLPIVGSIRWRGTFALLLLLDGWGKLILIAGAAQWIPLSARNVLISYAVNSALVACIGWSAIFRSVPSSAGSRFFSRQIAAAAMGSGWFFAGIGIGAWLINLSDRVVLSMLVPAHDVGIYVAGYQTSSILPVGFSALITAFVTPILLQKQAAAPEEATHLFGRTVALVVWVMLPATILAVAERHFLLRLATSGGYAAAAPVVQWVAPALALLAVNNTTSIAFWMAKRIKEYFFIALGAGAINVAINLLFIPRIGFMAAAISTFITYAVQVAATSIIGRRYIHWRVGLGEMTAIGAGAAALLAVYLLFRGAMPIIEIGLGLVAYTVVSFAVYLLLDDDGRHAAAAVMARLRGMAGR